jgi:glyoxylase-like metal-dependent hydrolase (beta-lactamase superfamily II)
VFAQNYRPDSPYPKFHARYTRTIDYEKRASREETVRTQFENPPRGGGGQPLYRESPGTVISSDTSPFGAGAVTLTPHGFVAAALASTTSTSTARVDGRPLTVVSFTNHRGHVVTGYIDNAHLVEKTQTWVPNPILGDTLIETTYADYRNVDGVMFPTRITQSQGGSPVLEITAADIQPNAPVSIAAPIVTPQPARVESERIADGVWYLKGTPDPNSQLVEFNDFSVIVESSVTEGRALANIAEAKRLLPGKPVRYHVNSHHHGDHAAGVRAFIAEGSTVVTHEMNRRFYEQVLLKGPRTLEPDTLARSPRAANFVWVRDKGKYVITDGSRTLEVYHVPNGHAANLLMAYLPKDKLLLITDIFNDFGMPRPNDPPQGIVSPYYAALGDRLRELKLDVERLAPSHGTGSVPAAVLTKALQGKVQAPLLR